MAAIEKHLHEHFASLDETEEEVSAGRTGDQAPTTTDYIPDALDQVFAKVNTVVPQSPADQAGLKPGDEIRNFGYVNFSNHDGLKKVGECVQGNEGRTIFVRISRPTGPGQRQELRLTLTPRRNWGGRGMLGCHILPL